MQDEKLALLTKHLIVPSLLPLALSHHDYGLLGRSRSAVAYTTGDCRSGRGIPPIAPALSSDSAINSSFLPISLLDAARETHPGITLFLHAAAQRTGFVEALGGSVGHFQREIPPWSASVRDDSFVSVLVVASSCASSVCDLTTSRGWV